MAEHLSGGLLSQLPKSVRSSMAFFSFLRDTVIERYPDEESVNRHIEGERKCLQKTVWLLEHHLAIYRTGIGTLKWEVQHASST